jgi:hypothetical protein
MPGYEQIAGLENVYLEDSWVLGVESSASSIPISARTQWRKLELIGQVAQPRLGP